MFICVLLKYTVLSCAKLIFVIMVFEIVRIASLRIQILRIVKLGVGDDQGAGEITNRSIASTSSPSVGRPLDLLLNRSLA